MTSELAVGTTRKGFEIEHEKGGEDGSGNRKE